MNEIFKAHKGGKDFLWDFFHLSASFFVSAFNVHFMDLISSSCYSYFFLNFITIEFRFNNKRESCCLWYFFV